MGFGWTKETTLWTAGSGHGLDGRVWGGIPNARAKGVADLPLPTAGTLGLPGTRQQRPACRPPGTQPHVLDAGVPLCSKPLIPARFPTAPSLANLTAGDFSLMWIRKRYVSRDVSER